MRVAVRIHAGDSQRPGPSRPGRTLRTACLLAAALAGCGDSARIRALAPDAVILAFGDSLTSGKGAAETDTYPAVLARLTGYTVINAGRAGELTADGLARLPAALEAHHPDLVILCHGGNDLLQKRDPESTARNLDAMIDEIKRSGADVLLVGVPEPGIFLRTAPFYEELARRHGVVCDVETVGQILADGALKSDYVHPNAAGYRRLAEALAARIAESQPS